MTFSAAVIGCGRMGAFTSESVRRWSPECWLPVSHAEALDAHPEVKLAAAVDQSSDALRRMAEAWPGIRTYTDIDEMAGEMLPAIAGVATRTVGRAAAIQALFQKGVRAFHIEKPLCNSMQELADLESVFNSPATYVTYGALRRTFDIYQKAVAIAESGRLGPLREIRVNFGAAPLYWTQAHAIDLILFGASGRKVTEVQASLGHVEAEGTVVHNDPMVQAASVWFDDGVAGHIGRAPGLDFILSCSDGEVAVRSDGRVLEVAEAVGDDPYLRRSHEDVDLRPPFGAARCVTELVDCLKGTPEATASNSVVRTEILLGQKVAFGLVQSHLTGRGPVSLSEIDPNLTVWANTGGRFA